jgi:DNA polymerase-4
LGLCEKVGHRLRQQGCQGKVVQLKMRDRGFHTFTRRITLSSPTDSESIVYEHAKRLWAELRWQRVPVRLIGVGVQQLSSVSARQGDLFLDTGMRRNQLEQTLDSVQERFGRGAIRRAGTLLDDAPAWQSELYRPLDEIRRPHPAALPSPRFPSTSASGRSAHVQPS